MSVVWRAGVLTHHLISLPSNYLGEVFDLKVKFSKDTERLHAYHKVYERILNDFLRIQTPGSTNKKHLINHYFQLLCNLYQYDTC